MRRCQRTRPLVYGRSGAAILCSGLALVSCVNDLVLPTPPDVTERAARYDAPTAEFSAQNANDLLEDFLGNRQALSEVDDFGEAVDAIIRFDSEVVVSADGDNTQVEIQGTPIQTDALIEISGDCPGWSGGASIRDAFSFSAVVEQSRLVPVVWGAIANCKFERTVSGETLRVRFGADITTYLPNMLAVDELPVIVYVLYEINDFEVGGQPLPVWGGDFRIVDDAIEILAEVALSGTAVMSANQDLSEVNVRAANGDWSCFPQERRCESLQLPPFSY